MKIAPSSIAIILLVAFVAAPMPHAATAQLRGGGGKCGTGDRTASASPGQVQDVPGDDVALLDLDDVPGVDAEATKRRLARAVDRRGMTGRTWNNCGMWAGSARWMSDA